MADAILVYPKTGLDIAGAIAPPFSVMFAASGLLKEDFKVKVIDQRIEHNWQSILAEELRCKPDFVGVSAMTGPQIKFAYQVAGFVRSINSKIPIVWGGIHPTILAEQTLKDELVDFVVRGEAEYTLPNFVKALRGDIPFKEIKGISYKDKGNFFNNQDADFVDMESLSPTPWELIDVEKYISRGLYMGNSPRTLDIGETSRGCPFMCAFCCSSAVKQHKWRPMTKEKALNKIIQDVRKFDLTGVWIRDDNFYVDLERVEYICRGMIENKLNIKWYTAGTRATDINRIPDNLMKLIKDSGCTTMKIGAESGSDTTLKYIRKAETRQDILNANKKVINYDIKPIYTFMIGFPDETEAGWAETLDVMNKLQVDNKDAMIDALNMFTPHPATELYEIAKKKGLKEPDDLKAWQDWVFRGNNKASWLSKEERRLIENICDISIYFENVSRVFDTIANPVKRKFFKILFFLPQLYYKIRWRNRWFRFDPTLRFLRFVRKVYCGGL